MIKAIIVDDEQHCINRLSGLLAAHYSDEIKLVASCTSVEEGLAAIKNLHPDLLFLDVEIHDKTGFDLLKEIPQVHFDVIFTTAHDKYAVKAFKFCAIDYLLKPIDSDDLAEAINKSVKEFSQRNTSEKLDMLYYNIKNITGSAKKICVPVVSGLIFLQIDDIIRCESQVNYTTIFMKNKSKLMAAKTLKEFEEMLVDYHFYRVHNSHLINLNYIKSYNKGKGGSVVMEDGSEIEVSTRRKDEFLKKMMND